MLAAAELGKMIGTEFGVEVDQTFLFDHPTVGFFADALLAQLTAAPLAPRAPAPPPTPAAAPA